MYLVGAGAGDYKLLTLRALELVASCDVLVYDRLVNQRILEYARPECVRVSAGKSPEGHELEQDELNALLAREGRSGKQVVRLKGGDPLIFGRGGEEGAYLRAHGVPFEIVPGVSSSYACPAYAGIPLTHRGVSDGFCVVTARGADGGGPDYRALARLGGTLVFLMGMGRLDGICRELTAHGKPADTPAAVIYRGTTGAQRTAVGTLEDIADKARAAGLRNPAVIVVGDVVGLREQLAWREAKPLFGKRVMVTRTAAAASALSDLIYERGGEAVEFPAVDIQPLADFDALDACIGRIGEYTCLVFTSSNAADAFFDRLAHAGLDARALHGAKVVAIGDKTGGALRRQGIHADYIPRTFDSDAVCACMQRIVSERDRVLIPASDIAGTNIRDTVLACGGRAEQVAAYRNVPAAKPDPGKLRLLREGGIDVVTFASSSAVENFVRLAGTEFPAKVCTIGFHTTQTALSLGLAVARQADSATIESLVDAVCAVCADCD